MDKNNLKFNIVTLTSAKKETDAMDTIFEFKKSVNNFDKQLKEWANTEIAKNNAKAFLICSEQVTSLYGVLDEMEKTERNREIKQEEAASEVSKPEVTKERARIATEEVEAPVAPAVPVVAKASVNPYMFTNVIPKLSR